MTRNLVMVETQLLLLVEDNAANILIATTLLESFGYDYHLAKNGDEAVELFKNGTYRLILMDLQMPVMSGIEATKQIRIYEADRLIPITPIVALTANDTMEEREQCAKCGMTDFLPKPYLPHELGSVIAAHLGDISC